jgi:hypothetical protein
VSEYPPSSAKDFSEAQEKIFEKIHIFYILEAIFSDSWIASSRFFA